MDQQAGGPGVRWLEKCLTFIDTKRDWNFSGPNFQSLELFGEFVNCVVDLVVARVGPTREPVEANRLHRSIQPWMVISNGYGFS